MLSFSLLSVSNSLWLHEEQHARFPYPSPSPRVCSNACPLNQWCHQPSHPLSPPSPQSLPASGSLPESALNTRWIRYFSFSYSISPVNAYSAFISFRIDWFDLLKSFLLHHNSNTFFFFFFLVFSLHYGPTLTPIHDHWKNHSFDYTDLCWQSDVCAF